MAETVQMTIGGHSVVVHDCNHPQSNEQVAVDIWVNGDDLRVVKLAMQMAEAKAFHAALGSVIEFVDWENQISLERVKSEWRSEGRDD